MTAPVTPFALRRQLRQLLVARARSVKPDVTFCPSDVARAAGAAEWYALMPEVHAAARELVAEGVLEAWHRGQPLHVGASPRGPIRLRLRKW